MIQPLLKERIRPAMRRIRMRRMMLAMAAVWVFAALIVIAMIVISQMQQVSYREYWPWILGLAGAGSFAASVWGWVTGGNLNYTIQRIEETFPDLDSALLTAVQQQPEPGERTLSFLQQDVVRQAVYHSYDHSWPSVVKFGQRLMSPLANLTGLVTFAAAVMTLMLYRPPVNTNAVAFDDVEINATSDFEYTIEPGDIEIEKGTSLLVLARFGKSLPSEVQVLCESEDGEQREYSMNKSLDDPIFGVRIPRLTSPITYQVVFADKESARYQVSLFEYPELIRSDATIDYPDYTGLDNKLAQDVRRVSAVQGSTAELLFHLNKPVEQATLVSESGEDLTLTPDPSAPNRYLAQIEFSETGHQEYRLKLRDADLRVNQDPPRIVIHTQQNTPPKIELVSPASDMQVSALEEISVQANGWDDFGITQFGLSYTLGDQAETHLKLPATESGKKQLVEYLLALEELGATADQFLTYYIWAEDFGPDGNTRRVSSDVFFAEVRPFEEIYRQSEAPPGGSQPPPQEQQAGGQNGQNAQQARELAEIQKQIITATWNLIRRETGSTPTAEFAGDTDVLAESQEQALQQLQELAEAIRDDRSKSLVDEARSFMNGAVSDFKKSKVSELDSAFRNAKGAYQGLLKLRSREHQVQRQQQQQQQQSQSQSNSQQQQQQQLNQLNLDRDQNDYQQEQQAQEQAQQDEQQRENRQILSRLRELAQRQNDLNKRIKELQSALEEAETEEEKGEIQRELERLRDEQQKILRDAEEVQQRMEQSQNQQEMQEASEQMDQARENARRAADALEEGQVSRAAAEGQRTKEQLEELRDEFQNRTSGQFNEQMRQMRNEAQDIEQKQNELQDRLAELDEPNANDNGLRSGETKEEVAEDLAEQRQRVNELRDEVKRTVEEAEEYEPLLAEELYDTYRQSEQQRLDQALESTERSVRRGLLDDARQVEDIANRGIENLRKGIETAAESVLGDENQALENARNTIERLRRELENEIDQNDPQRDERDPSNASENSPSSGDPSDSPPRSNDDPSNQERTPGSEPQNGNPGEQGGPPENPDDPQTNPANSGGQGERQSESDQPPRNGSPQQPGLRDSSNGAPQGTRAPQENRGTQADPNLNDRDAAPLTGENFLDWSDRLRDVEEMVNDPELRGEASRIRDKAKQIRKDFKRHSKDPNWNLVEMEIAKPLQELQRRLTDELIRRSHRNAIVPLDRDPVPGRYRDALDQYYRELGTGQ